MTCTYDDVTCTYDDVTQAEEAEVAAIAELGALMQSLGHDAQTALAAARYCQAKGAESVEDLAHADFAGAYMCRI